MTRTLFIIAAALFFLWSCQPALLYSPKTSDSVDSVLFYQSHPVDDPFLDSLTIAQGNSAQLDTLLIPPPPPPLPDSLKTAQGFRIQIFAGIDSANAVHSGRRAAEIVRDSIYVFRNNGLFKTQVGDFLYRSQADSVRHILFNKGLNGAWIVQTTIFLLRPSTKDSTAATNLSQPAPTDSYKFTIQVLAVSDEGRAQSRVKQLIEQFPYPAFYKKVGSVFKLFVGKFQTRENAENALKEIRAHDFPDAWLVY